MCLLLLQERATVYMKYFVDYLPSLDNNMKLGILHNIRTIGMKWRELLTSYKPTFVKLKAEPALTDTCQALIDFIEGRT